MIEKIDGVINAISGFLYRPYIVPLILVAAGLYFTIRTGLMQFKLFGESIRVVSEKPKDKRAISSFSIPSGDRQYHRRVDGDMSRRQRRDILDVGHCDPRRRFGLRGIHPCADLQKAG